MEANTETQKEKEKEMILTKQQIKRLLNESLKQDTIIHCDMDGVIADFNTGAVRGLNAMLDAAEQDITSIGSRKSQKAMIKIQDMLGGPNVRLPLEYQIDSHKLTKTMKYKIVGQDPGTFFRNLPPLEDGVNQLWPFITRTGYPVKVLSAPIGGEGPGGTAIDGKSDWISTHLAPQPIESIFVAAVEKQQFALNDTGSPNILIDDKESTIEEWTAAGGIGILHETGNSAKTIATLSVILGTQLM